MPVKKGPKKAKRQLASDLKRFDALTDGDIDYQDAPMPDLADWVRHAQDFSGPPPIKASVTMRLDAEVLDFFKRQGPGYQTRLNEVLRAYVDSQRGKRRKTRA